MDSAVENARMNMFRGDESVLRLLDRGIDDMEAGRELPLEEAFREITDPFILENP